MYFLIEFDYTTECSESINFGAWHTSSTTHSTNRLVCADTFLDACIIIEDCYPNARNLQGYGPSQHLHANHWQKPESAMNRSIAQWLEHLAFNQSTRVRFSVDLPLLKLLRALETTTGSLA